MKMTGAQILCESLVREGVEVIFGLPGGAIISSRELPMLLMAMPEPPGRWEYALLPPARELLTW